MILPLCGVSSTLISDFLLKLSTDSREVISWKEDHSFQNHHPNEECYEDDALKTDNSL